MFGKSKEEILEPHAPCGPLPFLPQHPGFTTPSAWEPVQTDHIIPLSFFMLVTMKIPSYPSALLSHLHLTLYFPRCDSLLPDSLGLVVSETFSVLALVPE